MNFDGSEQIYNGQAPHQIEAIIDPNNTENSNLINVGTDNGSLSEESHAERAEHTDSSSEASTVEEETYDSTGSLASTEDEDEPENPPERIVYEDQRHGRTYYLVIWQGYYSIVRLTWETEDCLREYPQVLSTWELEKQKIADGRSKSFNLAAYNDARCRLQKLEKDRRRLRRLKRTVKSVLAAAKSADE